MTPSSDLCHPDVTQELRHLGWCIEVAWELGEAHIWFTCLGCAQEHEFVGPQPNRDNTLAYVLPRRWKFNLTAEPWV